MGIDQQSVRIGLRREGKGSFFAGGDHVSEEDATARAHAYVKRDRGDKGTRHPRLAKLAANLKTLFGAAGSEFHLVVRNTGATDVFVEKPFHGTATFEIHLRRHDGLDFTLQLLCGEGLLRVFGYERLQERDETRIGVWRIGLPQHFAEHVNDPGALGIDDLFVCFRRFGRRETRTEDKRTGIRGGDVRVRSFGGEVLAVTVEPDVKFLVGVFLRVGKEKGEIAGDGFVDPLIAIAGPADHVAPPLMGNFVKGNDIRKKLLAGGRESGALLSFLGKEGECGEVEKSRPALTKRAGNLRDAEMMEREGSRISFIEIHGGIDFMGELFKGVSGAWREWRDRS